MLNRKENSYWLTTLLRIESFLNWTPRSPEARLMTTKGRDHKALPSSFIGSDQVDQSCHADTKDLMPEKSLLLSGETHFQGEQNLCLIFVSYHLSSDSLTALTTALFDPIWFPLTAFTALMNWSFLAFWEVWDCLSPSFERLCLWPVCLCSLLGLGYLVKLLNLPLTYLLTDLIPHSAECSLLEALLDNVLFAWNQTSPTAPKETSGELPSCLASC